jgi:hypothetical protein
LVVSAASDQCYYYKPGDRRNDIVGHKRKESLLTSIPDWSDIILKGVGRA